MTLASKALDTDSKVKYLMQKSEVDVCLLTKSAEGMSLYHSEGKQDFEIIPSEVYDVTGAGDTVISAFAFARFKQLSILNSALFSNYCAALCRYENWMCRNEYTRFVHYHVKS